MEEPKQKIINLFKEKTDTKQLVYKNTLATFGMIKTVIAELIDEYTVEMKKNGINDNIDCMVAIIILLMLH